MDISKRLKDIRKSKDISVYKLSQLSGVSETHIRDLERGDRNPSLDTIDKIATAMGLSLPKLLNEMDQAPYRDSREQELVECFRSLSDDKTNALLAFLKTISLTKTDGEPKPTAFSKEILINGCSPAEDGGTST